MDYALAREGQWYGTPRMSVHDAVAVAQVRGLRVGLTTKGVSVTRDLELLQEIAAVPDETIAELRATGLFRILQPRRASGLELSSSCTKCRIRRPWLVATSSAYGIASLQST